MASVLASIPHRPYAVVPQTNLMNTDGFFIVNMGAQWIEAHVSNDSGGELKNVSVYVEGISDPGVTRVPVVANVGDVPAGATFPVRFLANFQGARPGVAYVSFIVEADGATFRRLIKKVFITRVDYHKPSRTYSVVMPQGTMRINIHSALMGPGKVRCREDKGAFVVLPKDVTYDWVPTPPYEGTHGPFPYEDPWWKIALGILAGLLALGALLYDYFSDGDLDGGSVSVSGTFEETDPSVSCCTDISTSATDEDDWIARGLYGGAGAVASIAIGSDDPDPHYRGQEATPPREGELTVGERVRLKVDYTEAPRLGHPFKISGDWRYDRRTTGRTYSFEAHDDRENLHWLESYEVEAPETHDRLEGPLRIRARFQRPNGEYYRSNELYVTGVLVDTHGQARWFPMRDHGMELDDEAADSWYSGGYQFRASPGQVAAATHVRKYDLPGLWYLFVFAQDVNTVLDGTDPFEAAHTIGGLILTDQLVLAFDEPCKLLHDAVIQVT